MSACISDAYDASSKKGISGRDFFEISGGIWSGESCDPVVSHR